MKSAEGTFILSEGDIEDYLPSGIQTVEDIVLLLEDKNWLGKADVAPALKKELVGIAATILEVSLKILHEIEEDVLAGKMIFPVAGRTLSAEAGMTAGQANEA